MRCCVPNCGNDETSLDISFHKFPKTRELRLAWAEAVGLAEWEVHNGSFVCSMHFDRDHIVQNKYGLLKIKEGSIPNSQDSQEELDSPVDSKICRVCLTIKGLMYPMKKKKLDELYMQVTGISVSERDRLPHQVCWECAARLINSAGFRHKAHTAHRLLTDFLYASDCITLRDIRSISRWEHRLTSTLCPQLYKPDSYDVLVDENQTVIQTKQEESENEIEDEQKEMDVREEKEVPPLMEVEIKSEREDEEIFFNEPDGFSSDDNKKLSEIYAEPEVVPKVRKKKLKKKTKSKSKMFRMAVKKDVDEEQEPSTTEEGLKKACVKRRKTQENLDESLFTITTMTYEEQVAEIEKRQESTNYRTAPHKCTICYRGFLSKDRHSDHMLRHSDVCGAFECFVCKSRLKSSRALRKHLTAQHTEKISCKGCPFVTRNRGVARDHERWHAGTKYKCPHCPSEFDKVTTYMGHLRIKHVCDFVCELCGFTFVSKNGIEVHKNKKHRATNKDAVMEGPYCEVCDVKFLNNEAHDRHLKLSGRHSSENDPDRLRNDSQSVGSRNGKLLRRVERRPVIHPRDPTDHDKEDAGGPVTCEQCGISLRDLRLYAQHFRRAHPDKNRTKYPAMKTPAMCEQCGRIFQSMALLKDHMWVHTGEKRFKCDRCDKSFTQKTNLMFHMKVHNNTRPSYECPLCGKQFSFYNNRRRHMFIHTGLKPYKCETCGKCFTTSGEQRAHTEHVHLKKPWPKRARTQHGVPPPHTGGSAQWQKCIDGVED